MDARAIELVDWELKKKIAHFAYLVAGFKAMKGAHSQIRCVGDADSASGELVLIGNGRFYGGGNVVTETAAIDDGRLDLYSLEFLHAWRLVLLLRAFRRGEHTARPEVRDLHGQGFEIQTRRPRPVNADGEIVTYTPAVFEVLPKAIEIFVPSK